MKHSADLVVESESTLVIDVLADLSTYPSWNDLVSEATPIEVQPDDLGPAWRTTLRAQIGPFARAKQLRFVRDKLKTHGPVHSVRYVRHELDGREHAQWTMEALVEPVGDASHVTLSLSYDGGLWVPALGTVLSSAIERATRRLPSYLESR